MSCVQTLSGLGVNCETSTGGINYVYIANYADVTSVALDETSNKIKTITMDTSKKFYKYAFRRGSSSFTSTLNVDDAAGSNFVQTDLSLVFAKMDTQKRIEMSALVLGELAIIVKDANGKYWYLGYNEPVMATAGGATTGTARTDANNYTLTATDYSATFPYEVDPAALAEIVNE